MQKVKFLFNITNKFKVKFLDISGSIESYKNEMETLI